MKKEASPFGLSARQLIEAMHEGVILADPRGTIRAVNRAFSAVTGYSRREALGKNPSMLQSGRHGRPFYSAMWSTVLEHGSWCGEIWNRRKNGTIYPEWLEISTIKDAKGSTRCYLGVFNDITHRKISEERLKRQTQHDLLTDLPNRRLFSERLARAMDRSSSGRKLAVISLDIDRFKDINDHWGHATGDLFLRAVGARLQGCVRRTDTVARWGGDEFAVLLTPLAKRQDAARVAKKIARVLNQPFNLHGHATKTSASLGVCMLEAASAPAALIRRADKAMYSVKKRGGNGFELCGD